MSDSTHNKAGITVSRGRSDEYGGLPTVTLEHDGARTAIATHGAHVLDYRPRAQPAVLWLSPTAVFDGVRAIRGGIPICWPWFGDHPDDAQRPAHGFVRTMPWTLVATDSDSGHKSATFALRDSAQTRALWPHAFSLSYRVSLSDVLTVALTVSNTGTAAMRFCGALHSYFAVNDIARVELDGLGGCDYLDKVRGFVRDTQRERRLRFSGETDRIYLHTDAECVIDDRAGARRIRVAKTGSQSTVVWNPWQARARSMVDFADNGWQSMLCVETTNAADDSIELAPAAQHTLSAEIESRS